MKKKATARWRVHLTRGWLRTALSLCALLALLSMLALFTSGGPLPVQIAAVPQGGAVYLLEEWEDLCLLAYGGSEAGSGAPARPLPKPAFLAALCGLPCGETLCLPWKKGKMGLSSRSFPCLN